MKEAWGKIKPAAHYAGISERTFRNWLNEGLIHSRLPSGTILIRYEDIDSFLKDFAVTGSEVDGLVTETLREF